MVLIIMNIGAADAAVVAAEGVVAAATQMMINHTNDDQ